MRDREEPDDQQQYAEAQEPCRADERHGLLVASAEKHEAMRGEERRHAERDDGKDDAFEVESETHSSVGGVVCLGTAVPDT